MASTTIVFHFPIIQAGIRGIIIPSIQLAGDPSRFGMGPMLTILKAGERAVGTGIPVAAAADGAPGVGTTKSHQAISI